MFYKLPVVVLQHNNLMVPTTKRIQSKMQINAKPNEAMQELRDLLAALSSKDWFAVQLQGIMSKRLTHGR